MLGIFLLSLLHSDLQLLVFCKRELREHHREGDVDRNEDKGYARVAEVDDVGSVSQDSSKVLTRQPMPPRKNQAHAHLNVDSAGATSLISQKNMEGPVTSCTFSVLKDGRKQEVTQDEHGNRMTGAWCREMTAAAEMIVLARTFTERSIAKAKAGSDLHSMKEYLPCNPEKGDEVTRDGSNKVATHQVCSPCILEKGDMVRRDGRDKVPTGKVCSEMQATVQKAKAVKRFIDGQCTSCPLRNKGEQSEVTKDDHGNPMTCSWCRKMQVAGDNVIKARKYSQEKTTNEETKNEDQRLTGIKKGSPFACSRCSSECAEDSTDKCSPCILEDGSEVTRDGDGKPMNCKVCSEMQGAEHRATLAICFTFRPEDKWCRKMINGWEFNDLVREFILLAPAPAAEAAPAAKSALDGLDQSKRWTQQKRNAKKGDMKDTEEGERGQSPTRGSRTSPKAKQRTNKDSPKIRQ